MYAPIIKSARRVCEHRLGSLHTGVLLTDVQGDSKIKYAHLLVIFASGQQDPIAFISSEAKKGKKGGSHFLCAFTAEGHLNFGASDEWADLQKFERAALDLVNRLGLTERA
jgi:hypothetical protein